MFAVVSSVIPLWNRRNRILSFMEREEFWLLVKIFKTYWRSYFFTLYRQIFWKFPYIIDEIGDIRVRFQTCDFLMKEKENSETVKQVAVKTRRKGMGYKGCAGASHRTPLQGSYVKKWSKKHMTNTRKAFIFVP